MDGLQGMVQLHVRPFDQAEPELLAQDSAHGPVDEGLRHQPLAHRIDQVEHVSRLVRDPDVDTGTERDLSGVLPVSGQSFVEKRLEAATLGQHQPLEAQLPAQDLGQDPLRAVDRHAVDGWVGGHHAEGAGVTDAGLPRRQEHAAPLALGDLHRAALQPRERFGLAGVVAQAGDGLVRGGRVIPLHGPHDRLGEARAEVGGLGVRLLVPPQPRVADRLDHQREDLVHPDRSRLGGGGGVDPRDEIEVEGAPQGRPFREDRGPRAHQPVGPLLGHPQECRAGSLRWQSAAAR